MNSKIISLCVAVLITACGDATPNAAPDTVVADLALDIIAVDTSVVDATHSVADSNPNDLQSADASLHCEGDETTVCDHQSYVAPSQSGANPAVVVTRLIVLGDSISKGQVAAVGMGYFDHLHSQLKQRYGSVDLVKNAMGQTATDNLIARLLEGSAGTPLGSLINGGFPASGHTIVVMTVGGDDINHALDAGASNAELLGPHLISAQANLVAIVQWLRGEVSPGVDRFPDGVSIYLMNVYDPTDGELFAQTTGCTMPPVPQMAGVASAWRVGFTAVAQQLETQANGFAVIDAYGHFLGHGHHYDDANNAFYRSADPTGWFPSNCTHPAELGHGEIAKLFWEAIDSGHGGYVAAP